MINTNRTLVTRAHDGKSLVIVWFARRWRLIVCLGPGALILNFKEWFIDAPMLPLHLRIRFFLDTLFDVDIWDEHRWISTFILVPCLSVEWTSHPPQEDRM